MPRISVSVTKTRREFAGSGYTTFARLKLKLLEGNAILVYEGNATGSDFVAKCERLKRQPAIVEVFELPSIIRDDWKQRIVRLALDQTSA
jgi:hypothetical protein